MIFLRIFIVLLSGALFWAGGKWWHNARRFIMPAILTAFMVFTTHNLWCLTMLSAMGFLCLGYGDNSPLRHIFGDGWGRGVWGLLVALALSLAPFIVGIIPLWGFVLYLICNFTLENALKKLNQNIGDPIIGAGFGLIVL